ncbi:hypothetical protein L873DRAFT_1794654 [Choiromyces venosus 120613-1]|uniref:Uncharacterized protein n=1 Tax=Choiromyces venosus 120613-1 TaxID=1336337 RepID=A0A3N4J089_9PEZI|nr:hypothetical protein L873DRAFT_1794654 [Choiromyces venosus 120613-1]
MELQESSGAQLFEELMNLIKKQAFQQIWYKENVDDIDSDIGQLAGVDDLLNDLNLEKLHLEKDKTGYMEGVKGSSPYNKNGSVGSDVDENDRSQEKLECSKKMISSVDITDMDCLDMGVFGEESVYFYGEVGNWKESGCDSLMENAREMEIKEDITIGAVEKLRRGRFEEVQKVVDNIEALEVPEQYNKMTQQVMGLLGSKELVEEAEVQEFGHVMIFPT